MERIEAAESLRRFLKNQRQRVGDRLRAMEQRIGAARADYDDNWEAERRLRGLVGKKPSLEYYDRRGY